MFHRYEIEVSWPLKRGYNGLLHPDGGMLAILLSQCRIRNLEASVKQRLSCPSGMARASTGLRRHFGSELVEPGALSRYSRGRALVRNRIGEDLTFNSRSARRSPPQCGWKGLGGARWWRECPRARFVKEGVIAVQSIGHQDRTSPKIARSIEILLISESLSGFTGTSSPP
jgi:hypothetical protein